MGTLKPAAVWDSDQAPNLQSLLLTIKAEVPEQGKKGSTVKKKKGPKKEPRLNIAIPRFNGNVKNGFEFGKVGTKHEKFRIYIHADGSEWETTIVIFHNIKLIDKRLNFFRDDLAKSYTVLTFALSEDPNDIEIVGDKA